MTDKPTIILVEDQGRLRDSYCRMLEELGYNCRDYSGIEGVEKIEKEILAYQPSLLLLDTKLIGITGWSICERVRQTEYGKTIGVIGMSSDYWEEEWRKAGADAFLDKSKLLGSAGMKNLEEVIKLVLEKYL